MAAGTINLTLINTSGGCAVADTTPAVLNLGENNDAPVSVNPIDNATTFISFHQAAFATGERLRERRIRGGADRGLYAVPLPPRLAVLLPIARRNSSAVRRCLKVTTASMRMTGMSQP